MFTDEDAYKLVASKNCNNSIAYDHYYWEGLYYLFYEPLDDIDVRDDKPTWLDNAQTGDIRCLESNDEFAKDLRKTYGRPKRRSIDVSKL